MICPADDTTMADLGIIHEGEEDPLGGPADRDRHWHKCTICGQLSGEIV